MSDDTEALLVECERHRRANLVRSVVNGYGRRDEFINEAVNADDFDRVPWLVAAKAIAEVKALREGLRQVAEGDYPADAGDAETWAREVLLRPESVRWAEDDNEAAS